MASYFLQGNINYVPMEDTLDDALAADCSTNLIGSYRYKDTNVKYFKVSNILYIITPFVVILPQGYLSPI